MIGDELWAGGDAGLLRLKDGVLRRQHLGDSAGSVTSISGRAPDDVWVAASSLFHFDGERWAMEPVPRMAGVDAILAVGTTDLWAVAGGRLPVLRRREGSWEVMLETDAFTVPRTLSGSGPDDVWVFVTRGRYSHEGHHWTTDGWSIHTLPERVGPIAAYSTHENDMWVSGGELENPTTASYLYHWDGTSLGSPSYLEAGDWQDSLWASGPSDAWATGTRVMHFDGETWADVEHAIRVSDYSRCRKTQRGPICGSAANDIWLWGFDGLYHYNGGSWQEILMRWATYTMPAPPATGDGDWDPVWMLADHVVLGPDLCASVPFHVPARTSTSGGRFAVAFPFFELGGSCIAFDAPALLLHHDGTTWSVLASFTFDWSWWPMLLRPWAFNDHQAALLTGGDTLLFWNGESLQEVFTDPDGARLNAMWASSPTDLWVAGSALFHWNGLAWSHFAIDSEGPIAHLWGIAPEALWAVGPAGWVVAWSEATGAFETMPAPGAEDLHTVWAAAADDVWVGASDGRVSHWDGATWTAHETGLHEPVKRLHGADDGWIWASSEDGVARYPR